MGVGCNFPEAPRNRSQPVTRIGQLAGVDLLAVVIVS
jgi:hypothetical protein